MPKFDVSEQNGTHLYRCEGCRRVLSLFQSPCEHLQDYHLIDETEIEFRELWTTDEFNAFNDILIKAFSRKLPIPRSRRVKADAPSALRRQKANYKVVNIQGEQKEIKTIEEKDHVSKEHELFSKNHDPYNRFYMMDEEKDEERRNRYEYGDGFRTPSPLGDEKPEEDRKMEEERSRIQYGNGYRTTDDDHDEEQEMEHEHDYRRYGMYNNSLDSVDDIEFLANLSDD